MEKEKIKISFLFYLVFISFILFSLTFVSAELKKADNKVSKYEGSEVYEKVLGKSAGKVVYYIIGPAVKTSTDSSDKSSETSAVIAQIALWLLIFITFGDIFVNFSSFSKVVSWTIAFLISIIVANIGIGVMFLAAITNLFALIGMTSVYIGLGASFAVFILVNLGITRLSLWIAKRKAMIEMSKMKLDSQRGTEKVKNAITGLADVAKTLRDMGKK